MRVRGIIDYLNETQRNFNDFVRVGRIIYVDTKTLECEVEWIDRPGSQPAVLTVGITNTVVLPHIGQYVICGFDIVGRAFILGFIPTGYEEKVKVRKTMPEISEGEFFLEKENSYLWIRNSGETFFGNATSFLRITPFPNGELSITSLSTTIQDECVYQYSGIAERYSKTQEEYVKVFDETRQKYITEVVRKVYETSDNYIGQAGNNPLIEVYEATLLNENGNPINLEGVIKNDQNKKAVSRETEIAFLFKINTTKSPTFVAITKGGGIFIFGDHINIQNGKVDKDKELPGEKTMDDGSKRGQHVAREHDRVFIPLSNTYQDEDHKSVAQNAATDNFASLQMLANCFVSPAGPCVFDPSRLGSNPKLVGYIAEGAKDFFLGDKDA